MKPFDADGSFRPGVDRGETRQLAVRGAGFTLLSGGLGFGVQMISTVVLARLLTPSDFGLVAMVTTFNLLLTNFGMNGFTEAIQQREEINRSLVSNLFWINLGVGGLLTVGFAASGSLMAPILWGCQSSPGCDRYSADDFSQQHRGPAPRTPQAGNAFLDRVIQRHRCPCCFRAGCDRARVGRLWILGTGGGSAGSATDSRNRSMDPVPLASKSTPSCAGNRRDGAVCVQRLWTIQL